MSESVVKTYTDFVLPLSVISKVDISRLLNEIERLDNELTATVVRTKAGVSEHTDATPSGQLSDFLEQNKLTLATSRERSNLISELRLLKDKVPIIHMTFAVPADRESLGQLVGWLRSSVHQQAVITVGLQPALIAGVYLRTPNHVHDFSLRAMLAGGHGLLVKELEMLRGSK
ncbi:MAG: hypothetical protein ABIQ04_04145 [Candidatus Saccharimonadales bacterium]